mgnify:FL=1
MKPISRPVRRGLILFFLTVALASVLHLALWAMQSYQSSKVQDGLEQLYHQGGLTIGQSDPNQETQEQASTEGAEENAGGTSTENTNAETSFEPVMLPEYRKLYEINSDIVGWLNIGDGLLSTPVMQRDNEYYLTHDFYGEEDKHGQVFLDKGNSPQLTDDNTILYGHNITSDRSMFNILARYKDTEFAAEHPVIQLNTLYNRRQYAVAAVYIVSTRPEHGELFDYISYLKFSTRDAKQAYIAQIQKRSLIDTGVKMTADDRLLTLSTCTYEFADARLVVVARQLREGESAEGFGKQVVKRENPVMPQIWNELFG